MIIRLFSRLVQMINRAVLKQKSKVRSKLKRPVYRLSELRKVIRVM